jgi:hypothetical protein
MYSFEFGHSSCINISFDAKGFSISHPFSVAGR